MTAYRSRIDLDASVRETSAALLQARLTDAIDLESQMKQAHWNVKGRDFFQLHELFDRIHGVVEEFVDLIAERITATGGVADGRVRTVAAKSTLREYPLGAMLGRAHLDAVAAALAAFGQAVRQDIHEAERAGDADTADVFTQISREIDKQLWFVEAHLAEPS